MEPILLIFLAATAAINGKWYSKAELKKRAYAASNYVANAVKTIQEEQRAAIAGNAAALGGLAYYYKAN